MTTKTHTASVSIIAPVYNEEKGGVIHDFFKTIIPVLEKENYDFEIVCIDDGSKDKSYEILSSYAKKDNRIKIIKFSRNFGKEQAMSAGFQNVTKDCAIPIDIDLQDPPALIPKMVKIWQKENVKSVLAKRSKRHEILPKRIAYKIFYKLLKSFSDIEIPSDTGDFRLVDKCVIDAFNKLPEKQRFVRGLFSWVGFSEKIIEFDRPDRKAGEPSQSFHKLCLQAVNAIFSFSKVPLRVWSGIGFFIALISLIFGAWIIGKTLILGTDVPGYASTITIILFLGGIQLISIGVVGEYVGRIYEEIKDRPLFIIEKKVNFNK